MDTGCRLEDPSGAMNNRERESGNSVRSARLDDDDDDDDMSNRQFKTE